ncbi:MAG: Sua5/YciO/YrdC/YwlC family protein, partial [Desulfopila sp.]|nr:Sua5/YciO/YrdC/YwlC family protein [Desulfopila sp.]
MKIYNDKQILEHSIETAVQFLQDGGVIGFPTETYYGLGVDPCNEKAVRRLFLVKQREINKPILLLVKDLEMLSRFVDVIPVIYEPLLKKFWPGPLTLLFPWKDTVSNLLTGGTGTVG